MKKSINHVLPMISALILDSPTYGQALPAQSPIGSLIEEIVITARKKSEAEKLQDVPVAVSAFTGEQLDVLFGADLVNIAASVPNATFKESATFPNYGNFYIRGMGVAGTVLSDDPAVGIFLDGMYLGIAAGLVTDTFDMEAVEILRGPQGTLFGRNVTGGAVILRTRRPTEEFHFRARGILGNDQRQEIALSASGPLASDALRGKLTVFDKRRDDQFDNLIPGGEDYGEIDQTVTRATLVWDTNEIITATLMTEHGVSEDDPGTLWVHDIPGNAFSPSTLKTAGVTIFARPRHEEVSSSVADPRATSRWSHAIAEIEWGKQDTAVKSITAWRDFEQHGLSNDFDGSELPLFDVQNTGIEQEQFSQEFIYAGKLSQTVDLTAGVFYFDQRYHYRENRFLGSLAEPDWYTLSNTDHAVAGLFLQTDIAISPEWNLTLGGRYSREKKEAAIAQLASSPGCFISFDTCLPNFDDDKRWNNFTPKVGLQWLPGNDLQLYGSWTRGFRSGGFNIRQAAPIVPGPYNEETVDAYEIGFKGDFFDNRLRLNAAYFYNEFDDLQRTVVLGDGTQIVTNAAAAVIQGAELEGQYLVADALLLKAALGYTDSELQDFARGGGLPPIDGTRMPFVPLWTRNLDIIYGLPVASGALTLRLNYRYEDEAEATDDNTGFPVARRETYNASLSYSPNSNSWRVSLFGNNLTNTLKGGQTTNAPGLVVLETALAPRSYGVELAWEY